MPGRLDGKVAVITGATSGIGAATARCFVAEGARVVIAGRSAERGAALAGELGGRAIFHRADVMHESEIAAVIDAAVGRFGTLDCLFNNAGAATPGELETITEEQFDYGMKLLVGSVMFGIKHAARVMQGGGSIINNSSIAAHRLGQGGTLYSAAKAAVSHITRIAGAKLGPQRHSRKFHFAGRDRHSHFLGRLREGADPERGGQRQKDWRSWLQTSPKRRRCPAPGSRTTSLMPRCFSPAMRAASSTRTTWSSTAAELRNFMSVHRLPFECRSGCSRGRPMFDRHV